VVLIVGWVMPEVTAAFVWYAFTQAGGTLSAILGQPATNFLILAPMVVISVAALWRNTAFSMLIFSAGLRTLPVEIDEAAALEGAGVWRRLRSITLPMLMPTIVTNLLLVTLLNLTQFTLIFAMTQGGPGNETTTLPIYIYREAFSFYQLGYGTAISLVLVAMGALLALVYVRTSRVEA
jgi:multiple sugar transport system permease protein